MKTAATLEYGSLSIFRALRAIVLSLLQVTILFVILALTSTDWKVSD